MDHEDRQLFAFIAAIGLVLAVPAVVGLGSLFVSAWLTLLNVNDVHGLIWGWMSERKHNAAGETVWVPGSIIWEFFLGVFTLYILYEIGELLYGGFRLFKRALS